MGFIFLTKWLNNKCFYTTCIWLLFFPPSLSWSPLQHSKCPIISLTLHQQTPMSMNKSQLTELFSVLWAFFLVLFCLAPSHTSERNVTNLVNAKTWKNKPCFSWFMYNFHFNNLGDFPLNWENFRKLNLFNK